MAPSSSAEPASNGKSVVPLPRRTFTVEFFVGLFLLVGVAAAGYLSVGLGDMRMFSGDTYELYAEFDNISGLKSGASVEIGGVPVGEVINIGLADPAAVVTMRLNRSIKIREDDIIGIRTKGIIGDRFVRISRGASDRFYSDGDTIRENTESVVDFEDVVGKIVHSLTNSED